MLSMLRIFFLFFCNIRTTECFTNVVIENRIIPRSWNPITLPDTTQKRPQAKELYNTKQELTNSNNENKKQNPIKRVVLGIVKAQSQFKMRFSKMSRKAKTLFCIQMLMFSCLIGGFVQKTVLPGRQSQAVISRRVRPLEVPYSKFMDFAEDKGVKVGFIYVYCIE